MASVTNKEEMKTMATDVMAPGADEPGGGKPRERSDKAEHHGFFSIYKKGQGYWTRVGTAVAAGLLIAATSFFIYDKIPPYVGWLQDHRNWLVAFIVAFIAGMSLLGWWLMNRPGSADFLIATDSEMKKVNWTSKEELVGSTKVVILFMFLIAALLFILDMYFTRVFYLLDVLVTDAPLWGWVEAFMGSPGKVMLDVVMTIVVFGGAAWAVYGASKSR